MLSDKQKAFLLEMAVGALLGGMGLILLLVAGHPGLSPIFFPNADLLGKFAASLMTIGGTVFTTGGFRYLFWVKFEKTQADIATSVDDAKEHMKALKESLGKVEVRFARAFAEHVDRWQPKGFHRPGEGYGAYRHLYWKTKDGTGSMWIRCEELMWEQQIQPFFKARARIDHESYRDQESDYVMLQLQRSLLLAATRIDDRGLLHPEMAGIYFFSVPHKKRDRMFGYLHHENMDEEQSLSACILCKTRIEDEGTLDAIWLEGFGGGRVHKNFPLPIVLATQAAA